MNFNQISIFLDVVKLGGVTIAARKQNLSQPSVTFNIQQLEHEMGCQLINRKRDNYSLTKEGKRFSRFAEYISRERQNLFSDITRIQKGTTGNLNLISTLNIAEFVLIPVLTEFKINHPSVNINIITAHPDTINEEIIKGKDIFGFTTDEFSENNDIGTIKFAEDQLVFITYPGHPFTLEKEIMLTDLIGETWISQGPLSIGDFLKKHKGVELDDYLPKIITGTPTGVITAVESKLGVGLVTRSAIKNSESMGLVKVINVKNFKRDRNAYCIYRKDSFTSELTQGFLEFIKNYSKSRGFTKGK